MEDWLKQSTQASGVPLLVENPEVLIAIAALMPI
jgi:hypothetical protein